MNELTPRKAIFDVLQRCPSGLTRHGLAQVAYGEDTEETVNAVDQVIWRLRNHVEIVAVGRPALYQMGALR